MDQGQEGYMLASLLNETEPSPLITPTAEPAPVEATGPPVRLSGSGQEVTEPFDAPAAVSRITFTHRGESNFIVTAFGPNGEEELFVNTVGDYKGIRPLIGQGEWYLEVEADGRWTAEVEAIQTSDQPVTSLERSGDYVSKLFQPEEIGPQPYRFSNAGEGNFIVSLYCAGGEDLPQNEIGPVDGSAIVSFAEGPCIWDVQSDGDWSLESGR
jgi:hypothetical protein